MQMPPEKIFDTGELTLNYIEGGAGAPMVLLHGLTSQKLQWYPVLPELTQSWHVYAPDLRGHGKTGHAPDEHYGNGDYARDVIAFLKQIGEPAVLMGHSLGAMVAIVAAAQYPEGARAAILLDPPLLTFSESIDVQPEVAHWFRTVAEVNEGDPPHETRVARLRARMPDAPEEQINGMAGFLAGVVSGAPLAAVHGAMWAGLDLPRTLQQIKCPTLLIHGDWERGAAMRPEDIEMFKANCPSAKVVRIPDADHGLKMQEQPEIVLQHVKAFLQAL